MQQSALLFVVSTFMVSQYDAFSIPRAANYFRTLEQSQYQHQHLQQPQYQQHHQQQQQQRCGSTSTEMGFSTSSANYLDALSWSTDPALSSWNTLPANVDMYLSDLTQMAVASQSSDNVEDYLNTLERAFASSSSFIADAGPAAPAVVTAAPVIKVAAPAVVAATTSTTAATSPIVLTATPAAVTASATPAAVTAVPAVKAAATVPAVVAAAPVVKAAAAPVVVTAVPVVKAAATAAITAAPAATQAITAAATKTNDLASQLSGLSYDNLASEPLKAVGGSAAAAKASAVKATAFALPSFDFQTFFNNGMNAVTAKATAAKAGIAAGGVAANSGNFDITKLGDAVKIDNLEQLSIAQFADTIIGGIQRVGGGVLEVIDTTSKEPTIAWVGAKAQASVSALLDSASHAALSKVSQLGTEVSHMTVQQVITSLVQLFITVTNVLYTIVNAIITVSTGSTTSEWAVAAGNALEREAGVLVAQASITASDLSHASFVELGSRIDHFSADIATVLASSVGSVGTIIAVGGGGM